MPDILFSQDNKGYGIADAKKDIKLISAPAFCLYDKIREWKC